MSVNTDIAGNRARLSAVLQKAGSLVSIDDTVDALDIKRPDAAKMLARWTHQGWLVRVGPGLYAPVPLDSLTREQVLTDPWVLLPPLFDPCYVGGWTAAGHWDFTEQIFRSIYVFTARRVRRKRQIHHGTEFVLKHTGKENFFSLKALWRGDTKVMISDKHRTILDMMDTPASGGGMVHIAECFKAYLQDQESDMNLLIAYADRLGNGAVFKRLGFLAEQMGIDALIQPCRDRITAGNARLDPSIADSHLVKRWNLWVPEGWS